MDSRGNTEFINRELSWIDFNFRVLGEAERQSNPLLERAKFCAIVVSNLDEFFMVRVALLHRANAAKNVTTDADGLTPAETLTRVSNRVHEMMTQLYNIYQHEIVPALVDNDIVFVSPDHWTTEDYEILSRSFDIEIYPQLSPLTVDHTHPFPLIASLSLNILIQVSPDERMAHKLYGQTETIIVPISNQIPRFYRLPGKQVRLVTIEDIITQFLPRLVGGYHIVSTTLFRITRDADITLEEDQEDNLIAQIEKEIKIRRRSHSVRLEVNVGASKDQLEQLKEYLSLEDEDIYAYPGLLDLRSLLSLQSFVNKSDLVIPPWPPIQAPEFRGDDIFALIRAQDLLLHVPYESFDPVLELVSQASKDPNVVAIKATLYRISSNSPLVRHLMRAATSGKQVTVLVEVRARFDEEANIQWAKSLDEAGAHVVYGVAGYKTHAKALLIVRREEDTYRRYVHLSTGNYNDKTAKLYTDFSLFTADPDFGADLSAFFNVITGYSIPPKWRRIEMAPTGLRQKLYMLINREIDLSTPERPGYIRAKMNSLIDPDMIRQLYRASQAGVRIELLVRGMCRLRPGVPGLSPTIRVRSILDRLLEHPRIFYFQNSGKDEVYLSSADWMERNLKSRLELMFPVLAPSCKAKVMADLDAGWLDNTHAWELCADGEYKRRNPDPDESEQRAQEILYNQAILRYKRMKKKRIDLGLFNPKELK